MGFRTEFNFALKLKPEQGLEEEKLEENKTYCFSKEEHRVYPVGIPVDLVNGNWEAVAKVIVTSYGNKAGKTEGEYKVIRIYSREERDFLTAYWRENVELINGEKIEDFSKAKVS